MRVRLTLLAPLRSFELRGAGTRAQESEVNELMILAGLPAEVGDEGGRSLPVKCLLAKEKTEGSIPFARSLKFTCPLMAADKPATAGLTSCNHSLSFVNSSCKPSPAHTFCVIKLLAFSACFYV